MVKGNEWLKSFSLDASKIVQKQLFSMIHLISNGHFIKKKEKIGAIKYAPNYSLCTLAKSLLWGRCCWTADYNYSTPNLLFLKITDPRFQFEAVHPHSSYLYITWWTLSTKLHAKDWNACILCFKNALLVFCFLVFFEHENHYDDQVKKANSKL